MAKLEHVNHGRARDLLIKTGNFLPELAELYDQQEFVHTFAEHLLVGFLYDEPVLGVPELWIRYLDKSLEMNPHFRFELYNKAFSVWPEIRRIKVWFKDWASSEHSSEIPLITYLEKPLAGKYSHNLDLRRTNANSAGFVRELIQTALLKGYECQGVTVELDKLREFVEEEFSSFNSLGFPDSVVVFIEDQPVGHATWHRDVTDPISGTSFSDLIDIYVLEDFGGLGIGTALSEFVTSQVPHVLRGNVVMDASSSLVIENLNRSDWRRKGKVALVKTSTG